MRKRRTTCSQHPHLAADGSGVEIEPPGLAVAHLRGGRDVVMPWVVCQLSEIALFEAAAHDNGAHPTVAVLGPSPRYLCSVVKYLAY